ncbi:MAG: hypothetical protein ACR2IV_04630 [Bryobacteraceae bacterium]
MNPPEPPRTIIGIRTAMLLYALLLVAALATLKGTALYVALVIVLGIAAKTYLHHLRDRIE